MAPRAVRTTGAATLLSAGLAAAEQCAAATAAATSTQLGAAADLLRFGALLPLHEPAAGSSAAPAATAGRMARASTTTLLASSEQPAHASEPATDTHSDSPPADDSNDLQGAPLVASRICQDSSMIRRSNPPCIFSVREHSEFPSVCSGSGAPSDPASRQNNAERTIRGWGCC